MSCSINDSRYTWMSSSVDLAADGISNKLYLYPDNTRYLM